MPIPKPRSGESRSQFVSRCVSAISDEYEGDQAVAICIDAWGKNKELHALNTPPEQLDWYWKTIDRKRASYTEFAAKEFRKALQQQFSQFYQDDLTTIGMYARNIDNITTDPIERAYQRVYQQVAGDFAASVYRNFKSKGVELELKQEESEEEDDLAALFFNAIKDFVSVTLINMIQSVTQTTRQDVGQLIRQLQEEYEDRQIEQFRKQLRKRYLQVAIARSMLIGRTEIIRASNRGMLIAANATNIPMQKVWVSTRDSRVRRPPEDEYNHWSPDGQTQALNEPFVISGELLQYPADPTGSPGNTINCRCTMSFRIRNRESPVLSPLGSERSTEE